MLGRGAVWLLWGAAVAVSAQAPEDPEALLERIRLRARANLSRLPDYVCLQTVERFRRPEPQADFEPVDTLRLEVGLVGDRELFAWPDAARFSDKDVTELVQRGTIGNGAFALHARNVFLSGAPQFAFRGEQMVEGRRAYRFDFDVPLERSTYRLRVPPYQALVAFHGAFWADAETLDLIRLRVEVDEAPPELGVAQAIHEMDYRRVRIGQQEFLLPSSSHLEMASAAGETSRNRTTFRNCRQFVGESSISFFEPREQPAGEPAREKLALPPRAVLELELETEIDPAKAALGDPVRAVVVRPVKEGGRVLVPAGAIALGRLVRLERQEQPLEHYIIGLEFHTLEAGATQAALRATMRKAGPSAGLIEQAKRLDPTFQPRRKKPFMQILVNEQQRGQGILHWRAKYPVVARGLRMHWEIEP
jgi:hypothetical protein